MSVIGNEEKGSRSGGGPIGRWMLDPLENDDDDENVVLTLREIVRIALVASEVGARFQREGIPSDPMAWMLAPRRAFHGAPPIEACASRQDCAKAVLIHGLGLDLDVAAHCVESLANVTTLETDAVGETAF